MTAHNPSVRFDVDDKACAVIDRAYSIEHQRVPSHNSLGNERHVDGYLSAFFQARGDASVITRVLFMGKLAVDFTRIPDVIFLHFMPATC